MYLRNRFINVEMVSGSFFFVPVWVFKNINKLFKVPIVKLSCVHLTFLGFLVLDFTIFAVIILLSDVFASRSVLPSNKALYIVYNIFQC